MRYFDPMKETPEGKLLAIVRDIEKAVGIKKDDDRTHKLGGIKQRPLGQIDAEGVCADDCWCKTEKAEKNYECNMGCDDPKCKTCGPKVKKGFFDRKDTTDRERQDERMRRHWRPDDTDDFKEGLSEYDPQVDGGRNFDWDSVTEEDLDAWGDSDDNNNRMFGGMGRWTKDQLMGSSGEGPRFKRFMHKRRGPDERGAKMQEMFDIQNSDGTGDFTSQFIRKYVQERSGDNIRPMFMEISGKTEIPAAGYQGNQVLPFTEDAPASKAINEVFKMPSVSQTGYDAKSSSMHMHYNDGGNSDYRAKVEESLADIKKEANAGQLGLIEEIAGKIEQLYARL